jgi:hypothetical protein
VFSFKGGNPTLSDDESSVDGDTLEDINETLNNAVNASLTFTAICLISTYSSRT